MHPIVGKHALRLVDYFRKTDSLRMYDSYLESEWYSSDEILSLQVARLRALVSHAYYHVPYYQRLFQRLGLHPCDVHGIEDLRSLPITTKEILRADGRSFMAGNASLYDPRERSTGGSTGEPLHYFFDRRSQSGTWAFLYRSWSVGGWRPGDRVVYIGGSSVEPIVGIVKKYIYRFLNNWLFLSTDSLERRKIEQVTRRLRRSRVRYIYGYASCIFLLAEMCRDLGIDDVKFRSAFATSEILHDNWRRVIEDVFSCEVFDVYGGNDGAGFAYECKEHDGLHCVCEDSIIEIVDEMGNPVSHGSEGRVLTTSLFNYAMPFIRYEVGDISSFSDRPCPCGRNSPLLARIQGRDCDFVEDKEGNKVYNGFFSHIMHGAPWISGFHVLQETRDGIKLYLRPGNEPPAGAVDSVRRIVEERFQNMIVEVIITRDLPRSPNGKFKYVLNKIQTPETAK